jgi:Ca2+-binding EF-hand superfamily protein
MSSPLAEILNDPAKLDVVCRSVFQAVDKDGSGQIDVNELSEAMNNISEEAGIDRPSEETVQDMMKTLDTDQSGRLSYDEFKVFVTQVLQALAG